MSELLGLLLLIWELVEPYVMWALMMIAVLLIFGSLMYAFIRFFAALLGH